MKQGIDTQIYLVISNIPSGKVSSYGDVAMLAGLPRGARRVARTLSQLPSDSKLPWHRVIRGDGKIAFPPESEGFKRQAERLREEHVVIETGRIDMKTYRWTGAL